MGSEVTSQPRPVWGGVPGALEPEARTLDLGLLSSAALFCTRPPRPPPPLAWLPRPEPPSPLASSPAVAATGTEPGTKGTPGPLAEAQPGATPAPRISRRADPLPGHPEPQEPHGAPWSPRSSMGAEGLTRTHAQKATSGGALSQQPWPQHGSAGRRPTITEATLACWLWTPPDSVPSLAPSLSGRATWQDDRTSWSPAPGTGNAPHTSAPGSLKEPVPHLIQEQRRGWSDCAHFTDREQAAGTGSRQLL